jgi:prepilin-type N-terminal cleavage/methylation domain-containing protein
MRLRVRRHRNAGFTLLELMVVVSIIGVLAAVFLDRVLRYQEDAELAAMEQTVGILRSALHLQIAGILTRGAPGDLNKLANQNPMDWLAEKPRNYSGEYFDPKAGQVPPGNWYFDLKDRQLVYLVDRGEHFKPDRDGMKWVRYRTSLILGEFAGHDKEVVGVVLAPVRPYHWF